MRINNLSAMPCIIKPGIFLITPLPFLPSNHHPPHMPSLACLHEMLHCFSNVTESDSYGSIRALLHTAKTPQRSSFTVGAL